MPSIDADSRAAGTNSTVLRLLPYLYALLTAAFIVVVVRWSNNFYSDDSYFYFQVARNLVRGQGSTFNGIMPTNGYHPLWMLVCVAVIKCFPLQTRFVHAIACVICLIDLLALTLIARLLRDIAAGFWWVAFTVYMPFCYASQLGTEGALSGLFLVLLMLSTWRFVSEPDRTKALLFALAGSLAVLSRLDNIFIVGLVGLAVLFEGQNHVRRLLAFVSPIYLLIWGAYIASNLYWFGILQPISGMLKAHRHGAKALLGFPHLALLALLIIVPSIVVLARFRRDIFFRTVEMPFALGVLFHASYIRFVLSNETRWSWYYTSWVLLAGVLLARVFSVGLATARLRQLGAILAFAALVPLSYIWYFDDYLVNSQPNAENDGTLYRNRVERTGIKTVIAYDKPGRLAFFTDIRVIALDGLMGDLKFQHDLEREGIAAYDEEHGVDAFVGPSQPLIPSERGLCGAMFLQSTRFHCVSDSAGRLLTDKVEIFARLSGASAGVLSLPADHLLWNIHGNAAIWSLPTARATLRTGPPITTAEGTP